MMTLEEINRWVMANRTRLNLSQLQRESGITNLRNIVSGNPDKLGRPAQFAQRHVPIMTELIRKIQQGEV